MKQDPKILLVVNWREEGEWSLYKNLKKIFNNIDIAQPSRYTPLQKGKLWKLNKYLSEFYLPFRAFLLSKRYDVIFSWSMRMGIIYGLLNRLFGNCSTRAKHVIYDFHLNLGRDDVPYRFKLMLTRFASRGIDFFLTTSRDEERIYSEMFRIQTQRIRFFPIFAPMHFSNYSEDLGDYIFSYGNSDRDYDTLVEAVRELPIRVIILSQSYRPTVSLPRNVSLITKPCLGTELIKMVLGSRMVVLPLIAHNVSAGQTALLESMALGRTVIVTENFATKEYGIHGESLFFYEAKNIKQLRELIEGLFDDLQTLRRVGEEARRAAAQFPEICLRVFQEVCERLVL